MNSDMQKDWMKKYGGYIDIGLNDTMLAFFNGLLGSLICSIGNYIYLKKLYKIDNL